jgi:hypothetical protein
MQVVVLGMHRSGTSALTRVLNLMGCWVGENVFPPVDAANPRGYWERWDVWAFDEAALKAAGAAWDEVAGLDWTALPEPVRAELAERARFVVAGLDRHRPWAIKDPRLCLTFPLWRPHLERPVCVIAQRGPLAIAGSMARRDGSSIAFGIALWERYMLGALASTLGLPRLLVSYEALVDDPAGTARALRERLAALGVEGLRDPDGAELAAFLDPALEHQRRDPERERLCLTPPQLDLLAALAGGGALAWDPVPPLSPAAEDLLAHHQRTARRRAERETELIALYAKIAADAVAYDAERAARLRGEQTIAGLLAEAEALRNRVP